MDGGITADCAPWVLCAAVGTDTWTTISNSLIISHTYFGVIFKYSGAIFHTTIVTTANLPNSIAVYTHFQWIFNPTLAVDTAMFGFSQAGGYDNTSLPKDYVFSPLSVNYAFSSLSVNNVTDAPIPALEATTTLDTSGSQTGTTGFWQIPGTTYGKSMATAFVMPGSDWRPSQNSPLRGSGANFGDFGRNCMQIGTTCTKPSDYLNFDGADIIGTVRPTSGPTDIGAWQSP